MNIIFKEDAKMRKSSKFLAVLLAAGMTLSMVACGNKEVVSFETNNQETQQTVASVSTETEENLYYNKEGYPICDEPITITVSGRQGTTTDWQNTAMVKYIEEELGIKLQCEPLADDAFATQYALMLSTNSMPDLIIQASVDKGQVNMDGADGYWLDLSQYLDIMPNFVAMMEEYPEWAAYHTTETGAIYSINRVTPGKAINAEGQIYYNRELVEAVYPEPIETIDDFYEALVAVKAAYPDKVPLSITFGNQPAYNADVILRNAFGITYNATEYLLQADENGIVSLGDVSDNYRLYLEWLNKLYNEGLLDPYGFTYTKDEYQAKEDAGDFIFWSDAGIRYAESAVSNNVKDFGVIAALSSEIVPETTFIYKNGITTGARIFVSAETKYPEAICRLIDFLCTEEGKHLTFYGVEGEHFEYVENEYGIEKIDNSKFADLTTYENATNWQRQAIVIWQGMSLYWNFANAYIDDVEADKLEKMLNSENQDDVWQATRKTILDKVENPVTAHAPLTYTDEETEERSIIHTDLVNYLKTAKTSFITGELDVTNDKVWADYVEKVNEMGYERIMKIEQAAWDRMSANLK